MLSHLEGIEEPRGLATASRSERRGLAKYCPRLQHIAGGFGERARQGWPVSPVNPGHQLSPGSAFRANDL